MVYIVTWFYFPKHANACKQAVFLFVRISLPGCLIALMTSWTQTWCDLKEGWPLGSRGSQAEWTHISELPQHPQVVASSSELLWCFQVTPVLLICSVWLLFIDDWICQRSIDMKSWERVECALDCWVVMAGMLSQQRLLWSWGRSMGEGEHKRGDCETVRSGFVSLLPHILHMDGCKEQTAHRSNSYERLPGTDLPPIIQLSYCPFLTSDSLEDLWITDCAYWPCFVSWPLLAIIKVNKYEIKGKFMVKTKTLNINTCFLSKMKYT